MAKANGYGSGSIPGPSPQFIQVHALMAVLCNGSITQIFQVTEEPAGRTAV